MGNPNPFSYRYRVDGVGSLQLLNETCNIYWGQAYVAIFWKAWVSLWPYWRKSSMKFILQLRKDISNCGIKFLDHLRLLNDIEKHGIMFLHHFQLQNDISSCWKKFFYAVFHLWLRNDISKCVKAFRFRLQLQNDIIIAFFS